MPRQRMDFADAAHERPQRRRVLREDILDVAKKHVIDKGWRAARVQEIAAEAGVSRPTLYKEFPSKKELGDALALYETQRFMAELVRAAEATPLDPYHTIRVGVSYALAEGEGPFLVAILREQREGLGGMLDLTRAPLAMIPLLVESIQSVLAGLIPDTEPDKVRFGAEMLVRLTLSFLVNPAPDVSRQDVARQIADVCAAHLGFAHLNQGN